ncbi:MAG: ABC transporter ATP-binding protein [Asticcacaulis sp.]
MSDTDKPDYTASLRLIGTHLRGSRRMLVMAVCMATVAVGLELGPVWALWRVIEAVLSEGLTRDMLLRFTGLGLVSAAAGVACMAVALALSHRVAFHTIHRLRLSLTQHMARLPLGYFSHRPSAETQKLVLEEPERLEALLAHGLPEGISALVLWVTVSLWMLWLDWRMALAALMVTPVSFLIMGRAMGRTQGHAEAYQASSARLNAACVDFLSAISVIKLFGRGDDDLTGTTRAVDHHTQVQSRWAQAHLPAASAFSTLILSNIALIVPVGIWLNGIGTITTGTLILFVILGAGYNLPLMKLLHQFHVAAHISLGCARLSALLDTPPQTDTQTRRALVHHDILFENVSFGYGEDDTVHNLSFTVRTGSVTALVGPSGAGKSTIAALVPRFHDVRSGRILIGGVDVRDLPLSQLMDTVAFVFQDSFLFSDTIAANIRAGKPQATDTEIIAAARAAQAHAFITALPEGYNTLLGEDGHHLSGGQAQRLAIARALLKDAPVLILDEPTAFADPDNEAALQQALSALARDRTLIVIAHRLNTICEADQILVIHSGRITERGHHDDLLRQRGLYAQMWHGAAVTQEAADAL